jgi:acetyl esterase
MTLDPQARKFLERIEKAGVPSLSSLSVPEARQAIRLLFRGERQPEPVGKVEDLMTPGPSGDIPVRVYAPKGEGPFPLLVYFHGGGFVLCDLDTHDSICRALTNAAGCITVSVDYRLAPEHKFPAAVDDCYAATEWVALNAAILGGDPSRIAVGGDSAGGTLAAVVALMSSERGTPPLSFQLLIYPTTDFTLETPSRQQYSEGYFLTQSMMGWFRNHYLAEEDDALSHYASPLRAEVKDPPPALLVTAEFDPLRDEGEAYGEKLREAGGDVRISRYDGMIHAFFGMPQFDKGMEALEEAAEALRSAFSA